MTTLPSVNAIALTAGFHSHKSVTSGRRSSYHDGESPDQSVGSKSQVAPCRILRRRCGEDSDTSPSVSCLDPPLWIAETTTLALFQDGGERSYTGTPSGSHTSLVFISKSLRPYSRHTSARHISMRESPYCRRPQSGPAISQCPATATFGNRFALSPCHITP